MNKLRVGIIGFGVVGKRRELCIKKIEQLQLVAVCDKDLVDSSELSESVLRFSNYREMLKNNLDIIFVCMTNDMAAEVTIAAIESGAHVFCEKPPGRCVSEIIKVREAEKKFPKCKLMYGFNHRYHDSVRDAQNIIESGELGRIINMRGVYGKSKLITFNQSDWRTKREIAGGGVLLDQGIHMVDLMRLFAGEFLEVKSYIENSYWGYDVEDNAYALLRAKNGVIAMLHSTATQWRHTFRLEINLENGSLMLSGILSGTKSYGSETLNVVRVDHSKDKGDPREQLTSYNYDPSWESEVFDFYEKIVNDEDIAGGSSLDALNTMKLVQKIYQSDPDWNLKYKIE